MTFSPFVALTFIYFFIFLDGMKNFPRTSMWTLLRVQPQRNVHVTVTSSVKKKKINNLIELLFEIVIIFVCWNSVEEMIQQSVSAKFDLFYDEIVRNNLGFSANSLITSIHKPKWMHGYSLDNIFFSNLNFLLFSQKKISITSLLCTGVFLWIRLVDVPP